MGDSLSGTSAISATVARLFATLDARGIDYLLVGGVALLQAYRPAVEPLLAELARHLGATELDSVRTIVADLERRIARFEGKG